MPKDSARTVDGKGAGTAKSRSALPSAWNVYAAEPSAPTDATASVVGSGPRCTWATPTRSSRRPRTSASPKASVETREQKATSAPSRPSATAVL